MIKLLAFVMVFATAAHAEQYIVNQQTGSDADDTPPFATISKCVDVVKSGDTCYVEAGVYRETVKPNSGSATNPITYMAAPGESVRVTGLDVSTLTWTAQGGGIFTAPSVDPIYDVFLNNVLLPISNSPNFTDRMVQAFNIISTAECQKADLTWSTTVTDCPKYDTGTSEKDYRLWRVTSGTVDETLSWAGGLMGMLNSDEYTIQRGTIVSSDAAGVVFQWIDESNAGIPEVGLKFQLTNSPGGIDIDNEWSWADGVITFKPAGGSIPAGLEIKTRQLAFDLHTRTGIVVNGFQIWAASIENNRYSKANVIDSIDAWYVRSFGWFGGVDWPGQGTNRYQMLDGLGGFGITLAGKANKLINSTITGSWCDAVTVYGSGHVIHNNTMTDLNWGVTNCGNAITGQYILFNQNTVRDVTRSTIHHQYLRDSVISYNDLSFACSVGLDCGVTYTYNWPDSTPPHSSDIDQDGVGTVMHHNWIHDGFDYTGKSQCLYLDNNERDYVIHHNVLWNCNNAFVLNDGYLPQDPGIRHKVYNNTLFSHTRRLTNWGGSSDWNLTDIEMINNLSTTSLDVNNRPSTIPTIALSSNVGPADPNVYGSAAANWADSALGLEDIDNNDFRPATGSPAINAGEVIRGITDDAVGAPDVGAYESGTGAAWVPGAQ